MSEWTSEDADIFLERVRKYGRRNMCHNLIIALLRARMVENYQEEIEETHTIRKRVV